MVYKYGVLNKAIASIAYGNLAILKLQATLIHIFCADMVLYQLAFSFADNQTHSGSRLMWSLCDSE